MPTELMTWLHAFLGNDVDWKQVLLIGMTPVFLIAFAIEYAVMTGRGRREPFRWKEIVANLSLGAGYQVAETVMGLLFTGAIFAWVYRHRLFDVPVNVLTIVPSSWNAATTGFIARRTACAGSGPRTCRITAVR